MANPPDSEPAPDFEAARAQILAHLEQGEAPAAYELLRPLLEDADASADAETFGAQLALLAQVSEALGGSEYAAPFHALAAAPTDLEAIHTVAYELHEQRQFGVAARLLRHGLVLAPAHPRLVAELVPNLEATFANLEAVVVLQRSGLVAASPIFGYSLAFNAVMIGEIELARASLGELRKRFAEALEGEDGQPLAEMITSVEAMLARHGALRGVCPLDAHDLVGWQLVLGGGALLHRSPAGLEDAMRGRYAMLYDNYALQREGLDSLAAVLGALELRPPEVVAGPERGAQILAAAAGTVLGLPVRPWSIEGAGQPGLVVVDELEAIEDGAFLEAMSEHRPAQLLYAHASCWTDPFFYTPDLGTALHQHRVAPWAAGHPRMVEGADGELELEVSGGDDGPVEVLAQRIVDAEIGEVRVEDRSALIAGLQVLRDLPEGARPGVLRSAGRRTIQRTGSPVPSNRFV